MAEGLQNLGVALEEFEDGLRITGGPVSGGTINSHGDHRIAMAFSVIALVARGPITILDTANVATSFPDFSGVMRRIGLDIQEQTT
jgi:3-phosphoshikimate 1-carboxyvinyltransferase